MPNETPGLGYDGRTTRNRPGVQREIEAKGGGGYSFVACLRHFAINDASLSRRSTVPTNIGDIPNIWVLIAFLSYTGVSSKTYGGVAPLCLLPVLRATRK